MNNTQNLRGTEKAVLEGKSMTLNIYNRKEERS